MGSGRKSAFKQALSAAHRHKSSATLARYRIALARLVFEAPSMGAATRDVAAHDVAAHDVASPYILLIEHKVEHRLRVSGDRLQRLGFEGRSGYGWLVGPGAANKFVGMLLYLDVLIDNLGVLALRDILISTTLQDCAVEVSTFASALPKVTMRVNGQCFASTGLASAIARAPVPAAAIISLARQAIISRVISLAEEVIRTPLPVETCPPFVSARGW